MPGPPGTSWSVGSLPGMDVCQKRKRDREGEGGNRGEGSSPVHSEFETHSIHKKECYTATRCKIFFVTPSLEDYTPEIESRRAENRIKLKVG